MRKTNEQPLKEVIQEMLAKYKLQEKLNETRLINSWEKLMGKVIAKRTKELSLKDKKLFIKLTSSALRQELSFSKEKIIALLNDGIGERIIEEVVLV